MNRSRVDRPAPSNFSLTATDFAILNKFLFKRQCWQNELSPSPSGNILLKSVRSRRIGNIIAVECRIYMSKFIEYSVAHFILMKEVDGDVGRIEEFEWDPYVNEPTLPVILLGTVEMLIKGQSISKIYADLSLDCLYDQYFQLFRDNHYRVELLPIKTGHRLIIEKEFPPVKP